MAVQMSLGGNSAGDGFLLAPLDSNYEAEIALWTDAGNTTVTLNASPNPAGLVFSTVAPINISTVPTIVTVHSTMVSGARGDTTIQVLEAAVVVTSFTVTSIDRPAINFKGRFEARFATQPALYNQNAKYKDPATSMTPEAVGPGWTWALEGEADFVPAVGNVPEHLDWAGMGRNIRLNNPFSARPLGHDSAGAVNPSGVVAPVVSTVVSITGKLSSGPDQSFTVGDPLIGLPANFGPDTYFAGNRNLPPAPTPMPEEYYADAYEPLGMFEIRFGTAFAPPAIYFKGSSKISAFTHKGTLNEQTRTDDSRPIATGIAKASAAEMADFSLPDVVTFTKSRIDALLFDYAALPAGASPARRNLVRRIGHLLGTVSQFNSADPKIAAVQAQAVPPDSFSIRAATLTVAIPSGSTPVGTSRRYSRDR